MNSPQAPKWTFEISADGMTVRLSDVNHHADRSFQLVIVDLDLKPAAQSDMRDFFQWYDETVIGLASAETRIKELKHQNANLHRLIGGMRGDDVALKAEIDKLTLERNDREESLRKARDTISVTGGQARLSHLEAELAAERRVNEALVARIADDV